MLTRLILGAVLLAPPAASAASSRAFVVRWAEASLPEQRALVEQVDRQLREELERRGADVVDVRSADSSTIVLTARLEVLPGAVRLHVVGLRGADRALLGTISTRASGSSRAAQLRAVVQQVCLEASRFE
ncbi:MAG: hypothetical protein AMXMBFR34_41400 [Myxococcaceae bacterium]